MTIKELLAPCGDKKHKVFSAICIMARFPEGDFPEGNFLLYEGKLSKIKEDLLNKQIKTWYIDLLGSLNKLELTLYIIVENYDGIAFTTRRT